MKVSRERCSTWTPFFDIGLQACAGCSNSLHCIAQAKGTTNQDAEAALQRELSKKLGPKKGKAAKAKEEAKSVKGALAVAFTCAHLPSLWFAKRLLTTAIKSGLIKSHKLCMLADVFINELQMPETDDEAELDEAAAGSGDSISSDGDLRSDGGGSDGEDSDVAAASLSEFEEALSEGMSDDDAAVDGLSDASEEEDFASDATEGKLLEATAHDPWSTKVPI